MIPLTKILRSDLDPSVNWVDPDGTEYRYIRRVPDYFIAYLSSHNGCNRACRMCHLTQTGQTQMEKNLNQERQLRTVLDHYNSIVPTEGPAQKMHINWMARGEPLAEGGVHEGWASRAYRMKSLVKEVTKVNWVNLNISTIMPQNLSGTRLIDWTTDDRTLLPRIYYSLYSMRKEFRRRWLPHAMDPVEAIEMLSDWQRATKGAVVLHWAFIEGQNDDPDTIEEIASAVKYHRLFTKFNMVRYNPFGPNQGREPPEEVVQERFKQITQHMRSPGSRIVPRVGFDVKASCGMFTNSQVEFSHFPMIDPK